MNAHAPASQLCRREIATVFADVFGYTGPLTPSTGPEQVEKWDSLQHIALIRALECEFSICLSMDEMAELRSVADIENILQRHGA